MGNNSSNEFQKSCNANYAIPLPLNTKLDEILAKIPSSFAESSVNIIVFELRMYCNSSSEENLKCLAEKLIDSAVRKAVGNTELCKKYVNIAQQLADVTVQVSRMQTVSFKDIFVTLSIKKLANFLENIEHETKGIKESTATFFGQLFVFDMISSTLMHYWVEKFNKNPEVQLMILYVIRDKVIADVCDRCDCDEKTVDLFNLLDPVNASKNYNKTYRHDKCDDDSTDTDECDEEASFACSSDYWSSFKQEAMSRKAQPISTPAKNLPLSNVQKTIISSNIQKTASDNTFKNETITSHSVISSSNRSDPMHSTQSSHNVFTMEQSFRHLLINIKKTPPPTFDFDQFKQSRDSDRKACAKVMLELAISIPENAVPYANLVRIIVCQHTLSSKACSQIQKTFVNYLNELCDAEMETLFSRPVSQDWAQKKAIGVFIGELYKRESVKKNVLLKWLNFVQIMVMKNDPASIQTLFCVLEVIMDSLMLTDVTTYNFYIKLVKELVQLKRVPSFHIQWAQQILQTKIPATLTKASSRASSVSSLNSEKSAASTINAAKTAPNLYDKFAGETLSRNVSNSLHSDQTRTQSSHNVFTMEQSFRNLLIDIKKTPPPMFDLNQFKQSQDSDRKACAKVMLELAISIPENAVPYANLVRIILCQHSLSSQIQKTFGNYLNELCDALLETLFNRPVSQDWAQKKAIGVFIGELYKRESMKRDVLLKWLNFVYIMVMKNDPASIQTLFCVLEIIIDSLKRKDITTYNFYIKLVKELVQLKRVPSRHSQFAQQILQTQNPATLTKTSSLASSVSSLNSETSAAATTNAAKTASKVLQPNATTEICSNFQKFLNDLQNGKPASHNYSNFHLCESTALRGCALVLIEHASLYPAKAKIYAALTANTLIGQMVGSKKKQFTNFLTEFFEAEIKKCFKPDAPEKSNWVRILNVGSFLSELYNFEVIDANIMGKWIGPIYQAGLVGNESALEALLTVQKTTALKMKERDIVFFTTILNYAEQMATSTEIPEKYSTLIKEVLMFRRGSNLAGQPSASSKINVLSQVESQPGSMPSVTNYKESEPCTSEDAIRKENLAKISTNCFEYDIDALKKNISQLNIRSVDDISDFASSFYRTCMKGKDFTTYARLAQLIDSEISKEINSKKASFRKSLCKLIQAPYSFDRMDNKLIRETAESSVKFAGELYKIGWLNKDCLKITMEALSVKNFETQHQIEMLHSLLKIISLSLIKNGDGEMCRNIQNILTNRLEPLKGRSYLLTLDILETINNILSFDNKSIQEKTKCEKKSKTLGATVEQILSEVNSKNTASSAAKLSAVPLKNAEDFDELVHLLAIKAINNPDEASNCAKLAVEIQELSMITSNLASNGKVTVKDILVEKCQETLLNNIYGEIKLNQLKELLGLLHFICELFICNVLNSDFINMCLNLISEEESDYAVDCIFMMMVKVGSRMDAHLLDPYFEKFEAKSEQEVSYRSSIYKSLIELRKNNWNQEKKEPAKVVDVANSSSSSNQAFDIIESSFETLFCKLNESRIEAFTDLSIDFVNMSEEKRKYFIQFIFKSLFEVPEKESIYAELCHQMRLKNKKDESFHKLMLECLRSQVIAFTCLKKDEFTEAARLRLVTVMLFIGQLYQRDFISDEDLEVLIKPAKYLSFHSISKLSSIIAPKVNESKNVRLMALLLKFDDIAYEHSKDFWKGLKEDIGEINEIVYELRLDCNNKTSA